MKKTLIALAAIAATSAFAQSTVTVYGQADAAYSSVKSGANSLTGLLGAGRGSNFVGFMGTEDLGGGLKANFKIEAGYNLDNGTGSASNTNNQANGAPVTVASPNGGTASATINSATNSLASQDRFSMGGGQGLTFNRWSYAGVSGGFGEVRVGREYTPTFQAILTADFLGANGVQNTLFQTLYLGQANSHANATNASNAISYETPRVSGFNVKAMAFFGENTSPVAATGTAIMTGKSGDGTSYRIDYTQGPINAGYAAQTTKGTNVAAGNGIGQIPGKYDQSTMYAKYDAGVAIVAVAQVSETMALSTGENKNVSNVLGLRVPMGATTLNASYTSSTLKVAGTTATNGGKGTQLGLQAIHALSKRTDLYVNYAVTDNSTEGKGTIYGIANGSGRLVTVSAAGDKSTAYQIGVRHNF